MSRTRANGKPTFLWQAGLILLPVLVIAGIALTSIVQNRTAVEREARRRAEDVARQYGKELERPWGLFLMQQDRYSRRWCEYLEEVAGGWPGSRRRTELEAEAAQNPAANPQAELAEWRAQFPGLQAEDVFPNRFDLTYDGRFVHALEFNPAPQPPPWFTSLSLAQRTAWESLKDTQRSGAAAEELQRCRAAFQQTGPGPEAEANAAFIGLRAKLAGLPADDAVAQALRFAETAREESPEAFSEAGLPLANLAFAEALRYARRAGPSQPLWEAIPAQVLRLPSSLTPALLAELEAIAGTNATLRAGVEAWRTLWQARLKLHEIADRVRGSGKLRGITTANLWFDYQDSRWLCVLNATCEYETKSIDGEAVQIPVATNTTVRFFPESVAQQALVRALENSEVKLPPYLGIAAWLEGEPLTLPERWSPSRDTNSPSALMAEANGKLSNPGKFQQLAGQPEADREELPSRPRFVLQLYLANPDVLYSAYRRHALLLGGLVAASAFAALIGVIASWRAFQRQLRLSELKSNFVSSVSHELRAPLASVRLMAESLERGKVSEAPKRQEYFRFIVQECRRLSSLIENVLDFSRIEQGRKQYEFEPTDLEALTRRTVKLMETYAAERHVQLLLALDNDPLSAAHYQPSADGKALQQALVNLIDNAIKHSPRNGTVTVGMEIRNPKAESRRKAESRAPNSEGHGTPTTAPAPGVTLDSGDIRGQSPAVGTLHPPPSTLNLFVEDHGDGIPPSEHEKIFERFYRRGSELRRETQGVGIGLSIVKHIVEAHGGRVRVRSAVGEGSRFTIELPINHREETKKHSGNQ